MVRRLIDDHSRRDPTWAWWTATDSTYGSPMHVAADPNVVPLVGMCGVALGRNPDALQLNGSPRCSRCATHASERGLRMLRDWTDAWWAPGDGGVVVLWHIVQDANAGPLRSLCDAQLEVGVRGDDLARSANGRPCHRCVIEADRRGYALQAS